MLTGKLAFPNPIIPNWLFENNLFSRKYHTDEEKMAVVIQLSLKNVLNKTGGPFGAAIFDNQGNLIAPGVNLVERGKCSLFHAEIVAIILAQEKLSAFSFRDGGLQGITLATSSQPCCQCFGAVWWCSPKLVIIGASSEDVEKYTGFDEGPLVADWIQRLETRSPPNGPTEVRLNVQRNEAIEVLKLYKEKGGLIYNPGCQIPAGV